MDFLSQLHPWGQEQEFLFPEPFFEPFGESKIRGIFRFQIFHILSNDDNCRKGKNLDILSHFFLHIHGLRPL